MNLENSNEEQLLREKLERSESAMQGLEAELRAVDAELEALAETKRQYELLQQVCGSLDELNELGAGHLFWGAENSVDGPPAPVRNAHRRIAEYDGEVARVKERRKAVVDRIAEQNTVLDYLHYDLTDAVEMEEERKSEWLVEREPSELPFRRQVMPWARDCEEDRRFNVSLGGSLAASLAIAVLVGTVALPIMERPTVKELPERVAKFVRKERTPPPPPPPAQEPVAPEEEVPEPQVVEEQPPEQMPEQVDQPVVAEVQQPEQKTQVASKGILAFRDSFARRANDRPNTRLGSQARVRNSGEDAVGRPERLMVTTSAPGSSGGINLADISRDVGGGGQAIEGVAVTRVASSIGGADGPDRPRSGGVSAGRTDEEIQIVFDRYKAALYRMYNRELRKNPTLRGQLVLRLTIEPDGTVSLCQLHSSELDAPSLAQEIVTRVLTFDFGAKQDIVPMTIIYPIDFLPAA